MAIEAKLQQALTLHSRGQLEMAEPIYRQILALAPDQFDSLHLLGVLEGQRRNASLAAELIGRALAIDPENADAHSNHGNALRQLNRLQDALAAYDRALRLRPNFLDALINRGNALLDLKRPGEALAAYDRALALKPDAAEALYGRGNALRELQRDEDALAAYDRALAFKPQHLNAILNRGNTLLNLQRPEEALAAYDRALALKPNYYEALYNRGNVLRVLKRPEEALACYDSSLALQPDQPDALNHRGHTLRELKRSEEAAASFARLLELAPDYDFAKGHLLHAKMLCCDWSGLEALAAAIGNDIRAGRKSADPFGIQAISGSARDLRRCAEIYAAEKYPPAPPRLWNGERYRNPKIRLGYVSGEFIYHSILILMAELFELHDRNRFELIAFDNGPDDGSELRDRFRKSFDEIMDITRLRDLEAATAIRRREIDILVNLNGYFGRMRQGVFAYRPSPVQVNYLGFPSTSGAEYMDYIIADRHVIPPQEEDCYSEKVVYLPDSYQVNDSRRRIAPHTPTRAEAGLPDQGFVFCCFNNTFKITPEIFDVWMRLLSSVPGSVLWLFEENAAVPRNLRREAGARGVASERLVFAKMIKLDEHLARLRLADLFLDTLPYTAHTTGSVALWAGLPVLTCEGTTFPARVGASLLHAIGLPELITRSLEEYAELALKLATSPSMLAEIRARLARNRTTHPLFDTDRYRRHLESAYLRMWERSQRGDAPASIEIEPG